MDDDEFDDLFEMSEAELEAEADREMRAYACWYEQLPLAGQIRHNRWLALDSCRSSRRIMRIPDCPEIIRETGRERLKAAQVRLLKVRTWRATGIYPGSA